MSCDKPIIEFQPASVDGPLGDIGRIPLFPVSKEQSIDIVIQIVLDFEILHRRQNNEPEMTEQERDEKAGGIRNKLRKMKDAVVAEAYTRATQGIGLLGDTAQITQFISDIVE